MIVTAPAPRIKKDRQLKTEILPHSAKEETTEGLRPGTGGQEILDHVER